MHDDEQLIATPLHRSTLRSFMVFGAERELALSALLLCAVVAFSALFSKSLFVVVFAVVMWFAMIIALRALARHDPMLAAVYQRHIKQQAVYHARSTPYRGY